MHQKRKFRLHHCAEIKPPLDRFFFSSPHKALCPAADPAQIGVSRLKQLATDAAVDAYWRRERASGLEVSDEQSFSRGASQSDLGRNAGSDSAAGAEEEGQEDADKHEVAVVREGATAMDGIVMVACGDAHSLAVDKDGILFACGSGGAGRTGLYWQTDAVTSDALYFHRVEALTPLEAENDPLMGSEDEDSCSAEFAGESAGSMAEVRNTVRVSSARGSLGAGGAHSAVISQDGVLYTFGSNEFGQLGRELETDGDDGQIGPDQDACESILSALDEEDEDETLAHFHPVCVKYIERFRESLRNIDSGDKGLPTRTPLFSRCGSIPKPVKFPGGRMVVDKVACGDNHTLAIVWERDTSWKGVYSWGRGSSYRLGHGTDNDEAQPRLIEEQGVFNEPLDISCGPAHSALITAEGEVYTWGLNDSGQCGHAPYSDFHMLQSKVKELFAKNPGTADLVLALRDELRESQVCASVKRDLVTWQKRPINICIPQGGQSLVVEAVKTPQRVKVHEEDAGTGTKKQDADSKDTQKLLLQVALSDFANLPHAGSIVCAHPHSLYVERQHREI